MRKHALILALISQVACATSGSLPYAPAIDKDKWAEAVTELPDDPKHMKRPKGLPSGEWVKPVEEGDVAEQSGVLMSEEKVWRLAQYKIAEGALRKLFTADRGVWTQHRAFYEDRVYTGKKEIHRLQPDWWDEHKFEVGTVLGILGGIVVTVAVLGVTQEVRAN